MPRRDRESTSKVTARCRLPLLHWILSDNGCQGMASVRGHPEAPAQAHHLCLSFKKKHLPPAMALHGNSRSHGRVEVSSLEQEGPPRAHLKRGVCTLLPESWWLEQGPPSFHGHQVLCSRLAWIPFFLGLDLPHIPTEPWLT